MKNKNFPLAMMSWVTKKCIPVPPREINRMDTKINSPMMSNMTMAKMRCSTQSFKVRPLSEI